jgi:hypothetical protein
MNQTRTLGAALSAAGIAGYVIGVFVPYPGRAFSVTGVMVGLTLLTIGGVFR